MKKILVTGSAGFIGSSFVKLMLKKGDYEVVSFDALTYAGNLENLASLKDNPKHTFVKGNIENKADLGKVFEEHKFDGVINFAAESHVDRSIMDSSPFVSTNVFGTVNLLDYSKKHNVERYLQVSTDEVYGSLGATGKFTEKTNLKPNSPYSASKTAADNFVRSYYKTFGFPALITRCSNNYGPYQFPEKLIPLMIMNALSDKDLPVYGDGMNVRDWIYVDDHCQAILEVYEKGRVGQVYNIGAENEMPNIEIVKQILSYLNKPESLIKYVKDRPGHDKRYAMDNTKISSELGWTPKYDFENGLKLTIDWYLDNMDWVERVISGEYRDYYKSNYSNR
ncbi:MAG: dTDP-glucose 4,6-dehydratase [Ignavibacteriae bacterium HGW-Ignavibacteriae-4]|jgi:dTDP-glucose 4,6-dehydratase|nr:MAG: dTDP-glucose 4,6-dehydratase [Ignavibacteriae bacterium HGW-Ignavibacteriae-4]